MIDLPEVMIAPEVAALLRMCLKTIYRLAEAGTIPGYRIGRSWRFNRTDILEFASKKSGKSMSADHVRSAVLPVPAPKPS